MFIHIGDDIIIQSKDVVSIIDRNIVDSSSDMEKMIDHAKRRKKLQGAKKDSKSVVVTHDYIYYSTLSVATLKKRSSMVSTISKLADYSDEVEQDF